MIRPASSVQFAGVYFPKQLYPQLCYEGTDWRGYLEITPLSKLDAAGPNAFIASDVILKLETRKGDRNPVVLVERVSDGETFNYNTFRGPNSRPLLQSQNNTDVLILDGLHRNEFERLLQQATNGTTFELTQTQESARNLLDRGWFPKKVSFNERTAAPVLLWFPTRKARYQYFATYDNLDTLFSRYILEAARNFRHSKRTFLHKTKLRCYAAKKRLLGQLSRLNPFRKRPQS